jgi:transcriptional regulator with XRE-family HTH domain
MQNPQDQLAHSLKEHRAKRGWSLDRTARETGVSKAMLGQIERGESSPTIATLWKIATGFKVPLTAFLEPEPAGGEVLILRNAADLRRRPTAQGLLQAILFPYDARYGFELYELTFLPGYQSISDPHEPGVVEHVTVLDGEMELLIEGDWMPLTKGQSLRFPADRQHGYRNRTSRNVVLHDIIHYPNRGPAQPSS